MTSWSHVVVFLSVFLSLVEIRKVRLTWQRDTLKIGRRLLFDTWQPYQPSYHLFGPVDLFLSVFLYLTEIRNVRPI